MQRVIIGALLCLASVATSAQLPVDFASGIEAYRQGDAINAAAIWAPLAERGDANAQYSIGSLYAHGEGLPHDEAESLKWYTRAADQGYPPAQFALGVIYDDGRWVLEDNVAAQTWYLAASKQGFAPAQNNLCAMLASGESGEQSWAAAVVWCALAARGGVDMARARLDGYAEHLERVRVTAPIGNVRSERGTYGGIVAKVSRGDEAYLLEGPESGWFQIYLPRETIVGFISEDLVETIATR